MVNLMAARQRGKRIPVHFLLFAIADRQLRG